MIQQKIRSITIDTTAPQIASVTGLMDGVAWDASDIFSGLIRDADNQSKLEYWANDGEKQAISLNSNLEFGNTSLNLISNLTKNTEHKLYLKAIDRAGNETQYDYSFMRLDLPGLLDDANWIDPVSQGEPDDRNSGTGTGGGNNPGDGTGRYYIGAGGGWGYSSGSGGTGWTPAPAGFSDNPPVPNLPGQDPNQQLTYLEALNVILNTAIDTLSKHTTVASKKSILQYYKTSLLGIGKLVEVYGLHSQMKTMLNSLFKLGYDPTDNRVSRQEAVRSGWAFAKSVALDTVSLKLKSFESQVYGMMAKNGLTVTAAQETQLQGTIGLFARRYAVLTPVGASYWGGENYYTSGFTQIAWTENWNYGNDLNNSSVNTMDPYYSNPI